MPNYRPIGTKFGMGGVCHKKIVQRKIDRIGHDRLLQRTSVCIACLNLLSIAQKTHFFEYSLEIILVKLPKLQHKILIADKIVKKLRSGNAENGQRQIVVSPTLLPGSKFKN